MNMDLIAILIFSAALVVYLTLLPLKRLNAFGNFLKKVLGVLPITKIVEAIASMRKIPPDDNVDT